MAHFSGSCNFTNEVLETRQSCQKYLSVNSVIILWYYFFLFASSTSSPNLTGRLQQQQPPSLICSLWISLLVQDHPKFAGFSFFGYNLCFKIIIIIIIISY